MNKRAIVAIVMFITLTPAVGVAAGLLAQGRVPPGTSAIGPDMELGAPVVRRDPGAPATSVPPAVGTARGAAIGGAVTSTAGLPSGPEPATSATAAAAGLAPGATRPWQPGTGGPPTTGPAPLSGPATTAPPLASVSLADPDRQVVLEVTSLELRVGSGSGDVSTTFMGVTEWPFAQEVSGSSLSRPFAFGPVEVAQGATTAPLEIDFTRWLPSGRTSTGTATVTVPLPAAGTSQQVDATASQAGINVSLKLQVTATSL